jgi:hypothetical protein
MIRTILLLTIIFTSVFILTSCELKDDVIDSSDSTSTVTIHVTAPNIGESIEEGSSFNITWEATGTTLVNILCSYDNGTTWTTIADSLSNSGVYTWLVPNQISSQCKIKIVSSNGEGYDISDKSFSIIKNSTESLTIVSPVGGESWEGGTEKQIKWRSTGLDSVRLDYTTDNGNHWTQITVDKKNTGIYYWEPVPSVLSNLAKIRIMDAKDGDPSVESANVFSLIPEPKLRIISPNGGETLYSAGNRKLEWVSENIENVKIAYSSNNGASWNTIIESTPSVGFYNWVNIPNFNSQNCKIRIYDSADSEPWDVSDSVFTITNQVVQTLEVTSPNGDENWQAGTAKNITWNSGGVTQVKIEYTTNNGIDWNLIVNQLPNTGAYEWNVPNSLSTQCLIRVSDALDGEPVDQSNSKFSIVPKPELKILSPNGGETWAAGQVDTIKWYSVGIENIAVSVTTTNGIVWDEVVKSTESDGVYAVSFTVPSNQYKIKIYDADNEYPVDESDGTFTVTAEPSISVVVPNGGEEWFAGSKDNIKWSSTNIEDVKLEYTTNNGATWSLINSSIPSSGVYSWNPVPNVSSVLCRVRISDAKEAIPSDISDENFTINNVQLIEVTSPNGTEIWKTGSAQSITWNATGIKDVKIEYTINNGQTWTILEESLESTGYYSWEQIPNSPSTNCKVRVSDADDGAPSDESDAFFSIAAEVPVASIKVTKPNGGEVFLAGATQAITWVSENIENVKIEYTTNGGAQWYTIIESIPSTGTYSWVNVPSLNSSQCKVRISDAADGIPTDISDVNFEISNQVIKSITILSPNGGEKWEAGTNHNITWNASNVNKVKIELTTNQGSTWTTIVDSTSGGAYEWNLDESLNATQCQIRLSDYYDKNVSDISDGTFTISPRKWLVVTGPETRVYKSNEPITISWESSGIENVGIKYTSTNGVANTYNPAFTELAVVGAANGSYTTYFSKPSTEYFVVVYNADEGADKMPSNNSPGFTVEAARTTLITVLTPNGQEQWLSYPIMNSYEIKWEGYGVENVKIEWSTNGGFSWDVITESTPNDGLISWTPTINDSSDNCLIRISDVSDKTISDVSDEFFSLHKDKWVRVEAPNGGEDYYPPDGELKASDNWPMLIQWTSYAVSSVDIYYSLDNGVTWKTIVTNYQSTGAYPWDFVYGEDSGYLGPVVPYPNWSTLGRIKVVEHGGSVEDVSDGPFWLNVKKTE